MSCSSYPSYPFYTSYTSYGKTTNNFMFFIDPASRQSTNGKSENLKLAHCIREISNGLSVHRFTWIPDGKASCLRWSDSVFCCDKQTQKY